MMQREVSCPTCGEEREFYLTASTQLHLGEKTKWRCSECQYGFVEVDGISTLS